MTESEFLEFLQTNPPLRIYYGWANRNNRRIHVRAIVDDVWVVYKWWNPYKQWWKYEVEATWSLWYKCEHGVLCDLNKKPLATRQALG